MSAEWQNQYLDFLIDPSFQGVNRLFGFFPFENEAQRKIYKWYYRPTKEIKSCIVMIDGQKFFDQTIRNNLIIYDNIQKIAKWQEDDNTTGCLLGYIYFKS